MDWQSCSVMVSGIPMSGGAITFACPQTPHWKSIFVRIFWHRRALVLKDLTACKRVTSWVPMTSWEASRVLHASWKEVEWREEGWRQSIAEKSKVFFAARPGGPSSRRLRCAGVRRGLLPRFKGLVTGVTGPIHKYHHKTKIMSFDNNFLVHTVVRKGLAS